MFKIMYVVPAEKKQAEIQWLKSQNIYPSCEDFLEWRELLTAVRPNPTYQIELINQTRFGMIVDGDTALAIKLRHNKVSQSEYRQK